MPAYLQFYSAWPSFFRGKSVSNPFMCRMIEWLTPRILLFHIEISRSFTFTFIFALNSENLHKSLNHCNSFNAAHTVKIFIHLHYCALHLTWFSLRFTITCVQEKSQKTDDQDVNSCGAILWQAIGNIIFHCGKKNTHCSFLISKIHSLLHYTEWYKVN
jgi:hypothetical protein